MSSFRPGVTARNAQLYRARAKRARKAHERQEYEHYAEQLENQLAAARRCRRCGRSLEDPESVKRGIGPECWKEERAVEGSPTAAEGATQ